MGGFTSPFQAVIGLGNPGSRYESTRHNAGFMVIDRFHARHSGSAWQRDCKGMISRITLKNRKLLLLKPMTYMNVSGESLGCLLQKYALTPDELVIIHDDLDIEAGTVRVKNGGGHGGHNGLRSIMDVLDSGSFARLRIGLGRPDNLKNTVDFVLSSPQNVDDDLLFKEALELGVSALELMILEGVKSAMDQFNRKKNADKTDSE